MGIYLTGKKLYGDDFSPNQLKRWYEDESEGYAELLEQNRALYRYMYHALNRKHGFAHIKNKKYLHVLGIGSAFGDEFLPIIHRIERLTIIDPSDSFKADRVHGVPCDYLKPNIDGSIPFDDGTFDLIICLGVLHHIPNVSTVMQEFHRCLASGGMALVREPIVSMGDWTKPRPGLTRRERGIPLRIFQNIIKQAGFKIRHQQLCIFPFIPKLCNRMGVAAYNNNFITWIDAVLCNMLRWNVHYHARLRVHKYRPESVYFVIHKAS